MPRMFPIRFSQRAFALVLLLLLPAPPLALLCRGRTPTRFDAGNLPTWERPTHVVHRLSRERQRHGALRANVKLRAKAVT